jgi:hypothetical protein
VSKLGIITSLSALTLCTNCGPSDSESRKQGGEGMLENAEFTIPIPKGYRSLSKAELLERVARAGRNSPTAAIVVTLESADHSVIGIERMPAPPKDDPPTPPTNEECGRVATWFAERGKRPVITGGKLVEHPREGLGASCQFTLDNDHNHATQVVTNEWIISCVHSPSQTAACQQVAAGFLRVKR